MVHQFTPRAQIGGDHRPRVCIRLENRFPQSLIRVRREQREAAAGDELLQFIAMHLARKQHAVQVQFPRQSFKPWAFRTVARNDYGM